MLLTLLSKETSEHEQQQPNKSLSENLELLGHKLSLQ